MSIKQYIKRGIYYILKGVPEYHLSANISYLSPNERLKGKRIIITGGGRGLGFAMAKKFVSEGANVLICGRNNEVLKEKAELLKCKYLKLDVQNIEDINKFFDNAMGLLGGIDCLVNNAGISLHEGNILNVSLEQFNRQVETNLRGAYFMSKKFIELYDNKKYNSGNILFISSERGVFVDDLPYGLTKAAINSLVKGLAHLLIRNNIRVNALAPGVTTSDMTGFKESENLYANWNANKRIYLPEEVAEIACFLLSDASNCLSGQILECNEGKSINYKRSYTNG